MINNLINNYLNNMTSSDLQNFFIKNNIDIDEEDTIIIYQYIKENNLKLLNQEIDITLNELKNIIKENSFNNIYNLYLQYEPQIKSWQLNNN